MGWKISQSGTPLSDSGPIRAGSTPAQHERPQRGRTGEGRLFQLDLAVDLEV